MKSEPRELYGGHVANDGKWSVVRGKETSAHRDAQRKGGPGFCSQSGQSSPRTEFSLRPSCSSGLSASIHGESHALYFRVPLLTSQREKKAFISYYLVGMLKELI